MIYEFEIPFKLPGLNSLINVNRTNRYAAAEQKRKTQLLIKPYISDIPLIRYPVEIEFLWIEPNARRDLDNIYSAKKFVLDALVKYGVLENDTQKHVIGLKDNIAINRERKTGAVFVRITEVRQ